MKLIKETNAVMYNNTTMSTCLDYSLLLNKTNLDFCIVTINGRYPDKGYCYNTLCDELCYVLEGEGIFYLNKQNFKFNNGDIVFIDKNDIYYWEGDVKLAVVCNPAWNKEQTRCIDELK